MEEEVRLFSYNPRDQVTLPNSTAVLVLGIISIVGCVTYGVVGLVCGIIALVLSKRDLAQYNAFPEKYTLTSYNNLKAGRTCAIIGTILSGVFFLIMIVYFIFIGGLLLSLIGKH